MIAVIRPPPHLHEEWYMEDAEGNLRPRPTVTHAFMRILRRRWNGFACSPNNRTPTSSLSTISARIRCASRRWMDVEVRPAYLALSSVTTGRKYIATYRAYPPCLANWPASMTMSPQRAHRLYARAAPTITAFRPAGRTPPCFARPAAGLRCQRRATNAKLANTRPVRSRVTTQ